MTHTNQTNIPPLSAAQKGLKRWVQPFVNSAYYDFWCREFNTTAAWQRCFARVVDIRAEAKDSVTIALKPNSNFGGCKAGQHINVSADINGRRISRCYSISSAGCSEGRLEITVRHDKNGLMSHWLHSALRLGDILELGEAFGGMAINTQASNIVMLAAGSGITPMISLIRDQQRLGFPVAISLLFWDRGVEQFCFKQELEQLAKRYRHFQVHFIDTAAEGKRISAEQVQSLCPDLNHAELLACGAAGFVEQAKTISTRAGRIQYEAFTPLAAPTVSDAEQYFSVDLLKSGRQIQVSNQQTLLNALEAEGVAVTTGCRMGICNSCACDVKQGGTSDVNSGLPQSADSAVKLCISRATSALQLDI